MNRPSLGERNGIHEDVGTPCYTIEAAIGSISTTGRDTGNSCSVGEPAAIFVRGIVVMIFCNACVGEMRMILINAAVDKADRYAGSRCCAACKKAEMGVGTMSVDGSQPPLVGKRRP